MNLDQLQLSFAISLFFQRPTPLSLQRRPLFPRNLTAQVSMRMRMLAKESNRNYNHNYNVSCSFV